MCFRLCPHELVNSFSFILASVLTQYALCPYAQSTYDMLQKTYDILFFSSTSQVWIQNIKFITLRLYKDMCVSESVFTY